MRVERDFQYNKTHLRPYGAGTYYVAEESTLVATLARQPADERQRQLALLDAHGIAELRGRLLPAMSGGCASTCVARVLTGIMRSTRCCSARRSAPGEAKRCVRYSGCRYSSPEFLRACCCASNASAARFARYRWRIRPAAYTSSA